MTARLVASGADMWHVFGEHDGDYLDYAGLVAIRGGMWRAYGSRIGVDNHVVSMEQEFVSQDEAVAWLLDGAGVEA